jgi:hypothetical protein
LETYFPQIDEDVQRHNELLQVIRGSPSEISEVVARRRKDFTKEFFVHLHTVAESYYDNPTEKDGENEKFICMTYQLMFLFLFSLSLIGLQIKKFRDD